MPVKDTQAQRLSPSKLEKASTGLIALLQIPDYHPQRVEYDAAHATSAQALLQTTTAEFIAALNALEKARDVMAKAEWGVYNFMQGAAEQVAGQFGSSSDEYASLGYKKKSEYKKGRFKGELQ